MILKLLKNELKASYRMPLTIYSITLFLGISVPILYGMNFRNLSGISIVLFIVFSIPFLVVTIITIAQRFGKNLFGDEGYLMFTLPVKTYELVLAKLICGFFWFVCGTIVYVAAGMLMFMLTGFSTGLSIVEMINPFVDVITNFTGMTILQSINLVVVLLVIVVVETVTVIQLLYFTSTVTNIGLINRFRGISGVVLFFVVTSITSTIIRFYKDLAPISLRITRTGLELTSSAQMELTNFPLVIVLSLNDVIVYTILFFPLFFLTTILIKKHLALK